MGSPAVSENTWWRRWLATQPIGPPLVGHRSEGHEGDLERPAGGERPMSEQPMKSDRDAVPGENVKRQRQDQVAEIDGAPPEAGDTARAHRRGCRRSAVTQSGGARGRSLSSTSTAGSGKHGGDRVPASSRLLGDDAFVPAERRSTEVKSRAARRRRPAWQRPPISAGTLAVPSVDPSSTTLTWAVHGDASAHRRGRRRCRPHRSTARRPTGTRVRTVHGIAANEP